jgi:hypothetical protein
MSILLYESSIGGAGVLHRLVMDSGQWIQLPRLASSGVLLRLSIRRFHP